MTETDRPAEELTDFLVSIGAGKTGHHAGRTLHDHLLATWRILKGWELDEAVVTAGLCHSVYGTDAFDTACLGPESRARVRTATGAEAEHLAYVFGAMKRDDYLANPLTGNPVDRFTGKALGLSRHDREAVAHILLANEIDLVIAKKGPGRPDKVKKKVGPLFDVLQPLLSHPACRHYQELANTA